MWYLSKEFFFWFFFEGKLPSGINGFEQSCRITFSGSCFLHSGRILLIGYFWEKVYLCFHEIILIQILEIWQQNPLSIKRCSLWERIVPSIIFSLKIMSRSRISTVRKFLKSNPKHWPGWPIPPCEMYRSYCVASIMRWSPAYCTTLRRAITTSM